jgi:alpha-galactosidase
MKQSPETSNGSIALVSSVKQSSGARFQAGRQDDLGVEARPPRAAKTHLRRLGRFVALLGAISGLLCAPSRTSAADSEKADLEKTVMANRRWAEQVFSDDAKSCPPVSFRYNGVASEDFIQRWNRRLEVEHPDRHREVRTLTLTDPATRLELKAVATVYTDSPGVDWTLHFTNRGGKDTRVIDQVRALDTLLAATPPTTPAVLHRVNGSVCAPDDWLPFDQPLAASQRIAMATVNGRSSSISPFFNVDWEGGGAIVAIGWSGEWAATVWRAADGRIYAQAGMANLRVKLHPGESIRSPRIMLLQWTGDDEANSYNLFRGTMRAHVAVRVGGRLVTPPIAYMSDAFYELNNTTESNVLSHLNASRKLGFEVFWLDAYWHGQGGFPTGQGNYGFPIERAEQPERFPHGLRAIGKAVKRADLKFLVWFEPERVHPGTLLGKEHPEWLLPAGSTNGGLFNLGIPAAREFMTKYLNAVIRAYGVTCLRIDYNIDPLTFWQSGDARDKDRTGITEIRYVEGLYRMWDDIRRANPRVYIDNCASGGRRIDLETESRAIPLWRTDNTCDMQDLKPQTIIGDALKNQVMTAGLSRYVPYSTSGQMGTTPYLFRSGFNGGIAFAQDLRPANFPREQLKRAIIEGKRIRKYYAGDFFNLSPVTTSPKDWCVTQYHRPDRRDGMVMAFRRPEAEVGKFSLAGMRGLEPDAEYVVTKSLDYKPSRPETMKGAELMKQSLEIAERPGSILLEYRRK